MEVIRARILAGSLGWRGKLTHPGVRDVAAGDPSDTPALHKKGGPHTRLERGCVESDEISRSNPTESRDVWESRDVSRPRCLGWIRWQKDVR